MTQNRISEKSAGLSEEEVLQAREKFGSNVLSTEKPRGFFRHFLSNLGDPVIRILLCALVVNLFLVFRGGDLAETIGIGISVFLAAFISTLSERGSEAAFRRLAEACASARFRVRRRGGVREVPIEEIVVGDRVLVGAGEQIPADGEMTDGKICVDQSSMTGENREIEKYRHPRDKNSDPSPHRPSCVFRGCPVLSGEGEFQVTQVGDHTFLGQISHEVQQDTRESPLKLRLTKLAKQISRLGYLAAFLVAFAYLFNTFLIDSAFHWQLIAMKLRDFPFLFGKLLHAFMLGMTVIVVAVPEGLPMMIAVVLSSNIRRMVRDQVLVRKPVGIEAAGSMNLLFTDKTGTLTEGKMGVSCLIAPDGTEYADCRAWKKHFPMAAERYLLSCRFNTSALWSENGALGGNATDRALLESAAAESVPTGWRRQNFLPFDSARKYSASTLNGNGRITLIKGAPERLIPHLTHAYGKGGEVIPFPSVSYPFLRCLAKRTQAGERVILIAEGSRAAGEDFGDLTLIGAVVLSDRIRPEASRAVKELQGAGIHVVMITGDNRETAQSIAGGCGILNATQNLVLTSDELAALTDDSLKSLLPRLAVVARALPADKSRLVRVAQDLELVVGMTGDGINDAPALKRADIGFAMGSGTQVARDAGDIIILDNNLSSIAKAVLYGRTIFKSIRKFITLQLTMNFCAVGVSMIGPFIGIDAPVTVVQMLWINIIMDTLGGLAFAGEAPLASYMKEKPKRRDEPILNRYMVNQILLLGGFTVALCLRFLTSPHFTQHFRASSGNICLLTAHFALFIFTSVFNCFNSRTDRLRLLSGIVRNRAFICIMSAVLIVQLFFVYFGGEVLRTVPLTPAELGYTMLLSLSVFPAELIRKLIWRLRGHKTGY